MVDEALMNSEGTATIAITYGGRRRSASYYRVRTSGPSTHLHHIFSTATQSHPRTRAANAVDRSSALATDPARARLPPPLLRWIFGAHQQFNN